MDSEDLKKLSDIMYAAGYSEEEVEELSKALYQLTFIVSETIIELYERMKPIIEEMANRISSAFDELKECLEELEVREEERKVWVPYNPPNENAWYNQYQKNMIRDKRSDMKHFTINRRE